MATNLVNNNISSIKIQGKQYNIKSIPFHGTEAEWNESSYVPKAGELIIYDTDATYDYYRFKIGDGTANVNALAFAEFYELPAAASTLGGVKSGGDVTITDGIITVTDDSHNHIIANVDGLSDALNGKVPTARTVNGKALSSNITLTASDVGADASGAAASALTSAKEYTDASVAELEPLVGTTDDITPVQVGEAVLAGRPVSLTHTDNTYGTLVANHWTITGLGYAVLSASTVYYNGNYIAYVLVGNLDSGGWGSIFTVVAEQDKVTEAIATAKSEAIGTANDHTDEEIKEVKSLITELDNTKIEVMHSDNVLIFY